MNEMIQTILSKMTLAEKIGQMTQVEKNSISPEEARDFMIGSVLSGGGGNPTPNDPQSWRRMVHSYIEKSLETRLQIPIIYGVDAVHGHNNVVDATIFPHNIGLGAARDPELVKRIAMATAREMLATGVYWTFAPSVAVPQDIRWGRTFEGYAQETAVVSELGRAYVAGLIEAGVLPSVKHYLADGGTTWGSSKRFPSRDWEAFSQDHTLAQIKVGAWMVGYLKLGAWQIDQGDAQMDEATLRTVHLPPYQTAVAAGALNVMASYSSWKGEKMHAHHYLLTDVLKGEFGFPGFIVSDWEAINQIDEDYYTCVVKSINAGLDMVMVPFAFRDFMDALDTAVAKGDVAQSRIDDAVSRILLAKEALGLFDQPIPDVPLTAVGCAAHRRLAREAVLKTVVLLKNEGVLPIKNKVKRILVAGLAADDIGLQCGGWTIEWMGRPGAITSGKTILEGIQAAAGQSTEIIYSEDGRLSQPDRAEVGIVVIAEQVYAEGMGDRQSLELEADQVDLIERTRQRCDQVVVVLLSGRPLIITEWLDGWDAFVAAWLPGSEADGLADLLFGQAPFSGRLSYRWPRSMDQIPLDQIKSKDPLFEIGDGLITTP